MPHKGNLLLASLSPGDLAALQPHLKLAHFDQEEVLFEAGDTIDATYFPTSAVISIVVTLSSGQVVEAAMVGRDGVVGASAALDGSIALSRAVIQLSGGAMVCSLVGLRSAAMQSQPLLSLLIRHEQTLYAQAQQSGASCGLPPVPLAAQVQRLIAKRYALIHARVLSGNAGRQSAKRDGGCAHASAGWHHQIHQRQDPDHQPCGPAGCGLRML